MILRYTSAMTFTNTSLLLVGSMLTAGVFSACAGGSAASSSAPAAQTPADTQEPAAKKFADMDKDERLEFMGLTILPEMAQLWKEFDPEVAGDFGCQTCHGDDMKEVSYKMPNGLTALDPADPIASGNSYDEDTTKFMLEKVVPRMAELMQQEPVTEFNCFSCHDKEE